MDNKKTAVVKAYYDNIDRCALGALDRFIKNGQPEHAQYLMTKMFNLASKNIHLFSGSLIRSVEGKDVYADQSLIDAVKSFLKLDNQVSLKIAVEDHIDGGIDSHPLFSAIDELKKSGELKGSVEVKKVDAEETSNHFMVMDDVAYRLELDHEPCNAIANFNDKKSSKQILDLFEAIYHKNNSERLYGV